MKVRELIEALKRADPDGTVNIFTEENGCRATCVSIDRMLPYMGPRPLYICDKRYPEEIEIVLHDDKPEEIPEPCTAAANRQGCTCRMSSVNTATIDPPEPILDKWCPLHGKDPDRELERLRDDERDGR